MKTESRPERSWQPARLRHPKEWCPAVLHETSAEAVQTATRDAGKLLVVREPTFRPVYKPQLCGCPIVEIGNNYRLAVSEVPRWWTEPMILYQCQVAMD